MKYKIMLVADGIVHDDFKEYEYVDITLNADTNDVLQSLIDQNVLLPHSSHVVTKKTATEFLVNSDDELSLLLKQE